MKKFMLLLIIVSSFVLARLMNTGKQMSTTQAMKSGNTYQMPIVQIATGTPMPAPTIGYEATIQVAQATADEARRVNAMVTAEFEQRVQEQLQITAEAGRQYFAIQSWTATAALTSIPLTMTQQVADNTRIANNQAIASGQLTATYQAPTQMAAVMLVRTQAQFATIDRVARVFFMVAAGIAMLMLVVWFVRNPILPREENDEQEKQPDHTEIWIRDEKDHGAKSEHFVFPCTDEQLTELAEMVMNGARTFGYNRMETGSRTFRGQRETLEQTRLILEKARLATNTHAGESVINERGVAFFEQWFETHEMPDGFEITDPLPQTG